MSDEQRIPPPSPPLLTASEVIDPPPPSPTRSHKRKRSPDVDGAPSPPPPMHGGPPEEAKEDERQRAKGGKAKREPSVASVAIDPEAGAKMVCGILDQFFTMLCETRYGQIVIDDKGTRLVDAMQPGKEEKDALLSVCTAMLAKAGTNVSPATAFIVMGIGTYGIRVGSMEFAARKIKRG